MRYRFDPPVVLYDHQDARKVTELIMPESEFLDLSELYVCDEKDELCSLDNASDTEIGMLIKILALKTI